MPGNEVFIRISLPRVRVGSGGTGRFGPEVEARAVNQEIAHTVVRLLDVAVRLLRQPLDLKNHGERVCYQSNVEYTKK